MSDMASGKVLSTMRNKIHALFCHIFIHDNAILILAQPTSLEMPKNGIKTTTTTTKVAAAAKTTPIKPWVVGYNEVLAPSLFICVCVNDVQTFFSFLVHTYVHTYSTTLKNNKDFKLKRMGKVFGENNVKAHKAYCRTYTMKAFW